MTKRTRIALWCLSHLGVAVLAFLAGLVVELRYGKKGFEQIASGGPLLQWLYPQYVELQRERGGYEQYRDALLDFVPVQELAQTNVLLQVPYGGKVYHVGRMLNYARLSRLESEHGNPGTARRYIDLAVEDCVAMKPERVDCAPKSLLEFLEMYEEIKRDKARTKFRRDKEAGDNFWTGPKKVSLPPR